MRQAARASFAAVIVALGVFSASVSTAQQPQPVKSLQFEVASIKPSDPKLPANSHSSGGGPGGQYRIVNMPLKNWVEIGLSVPDYALKAPSWLDTYRFDLDARMPIYDPANRSATTEMIRALLIERFGLKWHEEPQTVSGYELVTDKKVLAQPSTMLERLRGSVRGSGPTSVSGKNISMSEFAEELGKVIGRPIIDATHLAGGYDITLVWSPPNGAPLAELNGKKYGVDTSTLPDSVFTAIREQLGLRLQSAKVPSKVIVVDQINHQPTEN